MYISQWTCFNVPFIMFCNCRKYIENDVKKCGQIKEMLILKNFELQ